MLRISRKSNLRRPVALLAIALLGVGTALGQPGPTLRNFPATDSGWRTMACACGHRGAARFLAGTRRRGTFPRGCSAAYFGLGDATKIDRIEVQWPSGRKQAVTDGLTVNQTLRITEPK